MNNLELEVKEINKKTQELTQRYANVRLQDKLAEAKLKELVSLAETINKQIAAYKNKYM